MGFFRDIMYDVTKDLMASKIEDAIETNLDKTIATILDKRLNDAIYTKIDELLTKHTEKLWAQLERLEQVEAIVNKHINKLEGELVGKLETALEQVEIKITLPEDAIDSINERLGEIAEKAVISGQASFVSQIREQMETYIEEHPVFDK